MYETMYGILGVNIIITAIGLGINSPMWDLQFVFPRLILILFLLIIPIEWKTWSLDSLFFKEYCNSILVLTK